MKILCLHGMGTNDEILAAQTASFRALLPDHWDYTFAAGEDITPAAEGIGEIYEGPYCAYYALPTTRKLQLAHELIREIIEESGPFHGVISFSQGSALAASILLHDQLDNSLSNPTFRFAVFIGASLPFSANKRNGVNVSGIWSRTSPMSGDLKTWLPSDILAINQPLATTEEAAYLIAQLDKESKLRQTMSTNQDQMRQFHPDAFSSPPKISIPTAHIYGRKDPYLSQSLQLVRLCDHNVSSILEHDGGHCIPRDQRVSRSIAKLIERTAARADGGC